MKKNLFFINTHPIQYFAPLYKFIESKNYFNQKIFFLSDHGVSGEFDKEFNSSFKWDIPILDGYKFEFLKNNSFNPGVYKGFFGIVNYSIFKKIYSIKKKSIIVIHGWSPISCFFSIIISKLFGHITCLRAETPLSHELHNSKLKIFFRKIILKFFLFRFIDFFLFIGNQNKKFYEFYGVDRKKLIFTPYSVDNNRFSKLYKSNKHNKNNIKIDLGFDINQKILLFSGKLIEKKNPIDLLNAVIKLNNNNLHVLFLGDGILREKIDHLAEQHNFKNYTITGFVNQSEIHNYYLISDLFIMCSGIGETWGLSTNEAMNFGLPIILSNLTGSSSDLVKNNGYIFKTGNIKELAQKIKLFFESSNDQTKKMSKNSIKIINEYSYSKILRGLKNIT